GQVAEVETRLQATDHAVLRVDQQSQHPLLVQVCQQFVQLQYELLFLGHRRQIPVQTVDAEQPGAVLFDLLADDVGELAGRDLSRVDLTESDQPCLDVSLEIQP